MSDINMKRVLDRIRAFLNMAQSPNEAEAATAMEMAHKMLKEYNLSLSDVEIKAQGITEDNYEQYIAMPVWKDQLLMQICKTNYCESYRHQFADFNKWVIVGRPASVATVRIMADYLLQAIERWTERFEGEEEQKESYRTGMADMLRVRLHRMMKQETVAPSSTALMIRENALVKQYMDKKMEDEGGTKEDAPEFKIEDMLAYLKGQEDGKGISLTTQINTQTNLQRRIT